LAFEVLERRELRLRAVVAERELVNSRIEMLERLAVTADLKDDASGEHGYRVGKLASLLADELNWSREASISLELAARLHDIGKIGVPDRILLKSQELKDAERHFIGTHTVIGAELLAKSNVLPLRMAEDVARYHHEWWDGTGYPMKLAGKRIPIHARIVALADVFDALTHGRPYSEPWSKDRAIEEIRSRRGSQFDPDLTDLFLDLVMRLRREHEDLDAFLAKAAVNSPFAQARNKIRSMLAQEHESERQATASAAETVH
jgi:putative two-component system response regulator